MQKEDKETVLVAVGTTQFEDLIKAVDTEEFGKVLLEKGYTKLLIQFGPKGQYVPHRLEELCSSHSDFKDKLNVESFRITPNFEQVLKSASLVISHAGNHALRNMFCTFLCFFQRFWHYPGRVAVIEAHDYCCK